MRACAGFGEQIAQLGLGESRDVILDCVELDVMLGEQPRELTARAARIDVVDGDLGHAGGILAAGDAPSARFLIMRFIDRIARAGLRVGIGRRSTALLETVGRNSGLRRVTPVTNGLDGDVFWIVTEHGRKANYVRNIEANPRVRVHSGRTWRSGTARIVDESPTERLQQIVARNSRARANARIVEMVGTEHLVIRIDLDEEV
jgi:deazaflavin-dependent oxidoreductase (nitroreductase family)